MATQAGINVEHLVFLTGEKIVRRLDEYPELVKAMRDGDLPTGRMVCARLFDFEGRQTLRQFPIWTKTGAAS